MPHSFTLAFFFFFLSFCYDSCSSHASANIYFFPQALQDIVKPRTTSKTMFCNHSEIYLRARDAIISGQLPCSEDEAIMLASIYLRVELVGNKIYKTATGEKLLYASSFSTFSFWANFSFLLSLRLSALSRNPCCIISFGCILQIRTGPFRRPHV